MTAVINEGGTKNLVAAETLPEYRLVSLTVGALTAALCGAGVDPVGCTEDAYASGDDATIKLESFPGTRRLTLVGTCTAGDPLYTAASGKVGTTPEGNIYGYAMETVSANSGDVAEIEVIRAVNRTRNIMDIEHHATSPDTLLASESGSVHTNLGSSGTVVINLPQSPPKGTHFYFVVMAAQVFTIDAGAAGAIYIGGAKGSDNGNISADDEGESVLLVADGNGDYVALFTQGTWTAA